MQLSKDQITAVDKILKWYKSDNRKQYITLGGYAGTGKTTLISVLKLKLNELEKEKLKIAFCSYTGRATQNLKNKLEKNHSISKKDTISTIHGLIYKPIETNKGEIVGWVKKDEIEATLIIIDEASMVNEDIWKDLLSFNIPIIAVGDHGQLPPINGSFNLMENPELRLEEIHRQEINNPIIDISIQARTKGKIKAGLYEENIKKYTPEDMDFSETSRDLLENYNTDTLILCGYNTTRTKINQFIRNALGYETLEPQIGDRVICLRNNHKKSIYNGMLGTIKDIEHTNETYYEVEIMMDDTQTLYKGKIYAQQFGMKEPINFTKDRIKARDLDLFDFGYALTVHKAQGSQAKRVVLFEERFQKTDDITWKKWLYTGVTRAESELFIFGN